MSQSLGVLNGDFLGIPENGRVGTLKIYPREQENKQNTELALDSSATLEGKPFFFLKPTFFRGYVVFFNRGERIDPHKPEIFF